ncbi:MAG: hypothetical protein RLZZ227_1177, partial [Pseudomonadota bacterium]
MKTLSSMLLLVLSLAAFSAHAQNANDKATHEAILAALPDGVSAQQATADEIAQSVITLAFATGTENIEATLTQLMISLGELQKASTFSNAPRYGDKSPTGRFYTKIMNLASSNLDVSSSTYYALTVQDMTRLSAALREGTNFLNGAKSNAITR